MHLKKITVCIALAFAPHAFAAETAEASLPDVEVIGKRIQPLMNKNNGRYSILTQIIF